MESELCKIEGAALRIYRNAPSWDGLKTAAVGAIKFTDRASGQTLLADVCKRLLDEGFEAVIGPLDGATWHSYRVVTDSDGSAPFLLEPKSGEHDLDILEAVGFQTISRYFSARVDFATMSPSPAAEGITLETWDGTDPEMHFGQVYDLSCEAFRNNAFYTPISRKAFLAMYMPLVPMLRRELVLFARDDSGRLSGFLFGVPNYAEGREPQSVILKTYASLKKGAGSTLSAGFHRASIDLGFQTAIHALIHDDNLSAQRSAQHGAEIFRRYALMGRRLNG